MLRVLLVEDDPEATASLLRACGCSVSTTRGLRAGWERLAIEDVDLLVLDPDLRDGDGFALARELSAGTPFLVVSGGGSVAAAVRALRYGAVDYLVKPFDAAQLRRALARVAASRPASGPGGIGRPAPGHGRCGALRGAAPVMQEVYKLITRAAPADVTVCLRGESGTGKEMVARTLHQLSPRRAEPFVVINCGAITNELAESVLFGHERGSFTGADRLHRGVFEQAGEGTLFLDEVTEMPLDLQVKLLRVLEGGSVTRVGGEMPIAVRARVICATNRAPEQAVRQGSLRADVWYRLNVFPIALPPLRDREGDVTLLTHHFLQELNVTRDRPWRLHPSAIAALEAHWWPGNVRELKNTLYRSVLLAPGHEVDTIELIGDPGPRPVEGRAAVPAGMLELPLGSTVAEAERQLILATLEQCKGNKQSAANRLGVSLKRLYNRLNSYKAGRAG